MSEYILVAALRLRDVFSGAYHFKLPWFQRSYAWRAEHAGRLLIDILTAMTSPKRRYFLGHIRIAQTAGETDAALIDGQQRVITLTILFALLRDLLAQARPEESRRLDALIWRSEGDGGEVASRLELQPSVAEFFARHVQEREATRIDPQADVMDLPPSARNMLENRDQLKSILEERGLGDGDLVALAEFLLANCWVIVEGVDDEDEAWTMLATEEDTGLGFHSSEEVKVSIISTMPQQEQDEAGRIWEREMAGVAADDASALLCQIRSLALRRRSSKPVEKDLIEHFALNRSGLGFMRDVMAPRVRLYRLLRSGNVGNGRAQTEIAASLDTMWWLQHQLWVAPALTWLEKRTVEHPETAHFFRRLDRLAWMMRIAGVDPTEQETAFIRLINEIGGTAAVDDIRGLSIEVKIRRAALTNLRAHSFYSKHTSGPVLRRLSRLHGHLHGPVDGAAVTMEHVLPRNPAPGSAWFEHFATQQTVSQNVNRLGNLAFLNFSDNDAAANLEYARKREIMRKCEFELTVQAAASVAEWTPDAIGKRTEVLIGKLLGAWDLPAR